MRREHLEHVLRAASQIAGDPDVLVIGSQSVLGAIPEERLPPAATASIEVDVAFFDDPDDRKADQVDGAIGELSAFHETFGYYAQGVSVSTAVLPAGWRDRLVLVQTSSTAPGRGYLLDPHDCVVSKLVAGREKDYAFAYALVDARLVDPDVLAQRVETVDVPDALRQRLRSWVGGLSRP
ncbi:DUF6036 family nucleotidyltransferase [Phytohabitans sp. ZYX-F-186]|uniref:DUF6036 family nucleotidyltransferase n=1 Tax=Phytohabitans maris TaxID=3071409 RepID=A0ABU0ZDD0_9ACTN|nr:DUF6036 family nucleotidyltransferase [Phytohabitans sp. ZYX-F-186]MDQ7904325.1 DUF6036 family nucleotidyltransferase [Phytohabitans sp. ZYX-F-186]